MEPLHRYQVQEKRKDSADDAAIGASISSSADAAPGTSLRLLSSSLGQSLMSGMNGLRIKENIIDEGEEEAAVLTPEPKGVLLTGLQVGRISASPQKATTHEEVHDDLDLADAGEEDEELQFELS